MKRQIVLILATILVLIVTCLFFYYGTREASAVRAKMEKTNR